MIKIAIIVVHFGSKRNTTACLNSLKKLNYSRKLIKIFIIDNKKKNLGFAAGINKGIKIALKNKSIDCFLILNNDTIVHPQLLTILTSHLYKKKADIVGCIITYYSQPDKIWFAGGYLNKIFCYTRHPYMNERLTPKFQLYFLNSKIHQPDFITGTAVLIRRQVFQKIGFFDEDYFLYWEDVDFCYRAKLAGLKIECVNQPLVYHRVSTSAGKEGSNILSPTRAYYYARNPFLFMKKNKLNPLTGIIGQIFFRLPYYILQLQNINALKNYFYGFWQGVAYLTK